MRIGALAILVSKSRHMKRLYPGVCMLKNLTQKSMVGANGRGTGAGIHAGGGFFPEICCENMDSSSMYMSNMSENSYGSYVKFMQAVLSKSKY